MTSLSRERVRGGIGIRHYPTLIALLLTVVIGLVTPTTLNAADAEASYLSGVGIPSGVSTGGTELSVIDAYLESSESTDCWELRISGICLFVYYDWYWFPCITGICTSVDYGVYGSIRLSHFTPDFLVGTYPRLGKSPIDVARMLYADLQLQVTEPFMSALAGPVAKGGIKPYTDANQYSGRGAESQQVATADGVTTHKQKSILKFNEVDTIGHPGFILYLWNVLMNGDSIEEAFGGDPTDTLVGAVGGVLASAQTVPTRVEAAVEEVKDTPDAGDTKRAKMLLDIEGWDQLTTFDGEFMQDAKFDMNLVRLALMQVLGEEGAEAVSNVFTLWNTLQSVYQTYNQLQTSAEALNNFLTTFDLQQFQDLGQEIFDNGLMETFNEAFQEAMTEMQESIDSIQTESGGSGFKFNSDLNMCYGSARPIYPYHLSGFDTLQWKFNLPEMVYRDSYKTPFASDVEEHYIGLPNSEKESSVLAGFGQQLGVDLSEFAAGFSKIGNNWGTVYPRNGFVPNSDGMKVGGVTSVRSVHVVTRDDQLHVYNHITNPEDKRSPLGNPDPMMDEISSDGLSNIDFSGLISQVRETASFGPNSDKENFIYEYPKAFTLTDRTTGKWQLMGPKGGDRCFDKFGDGDYESTGSSETFSSDPTDPSSEEIVVDTSATEVAWSNGKQSEDDGYVYTLWREYTCCETPHGRKRSIIFGFVYIGPLVLDIQLL